MSRPGHHCKTEMTRATRPALLRVPRMRPARRLSCLCALVTAGCIVEKAAGGSECSEGFAPYAGECVGICIDTDGDRHGEGGGCEPDNCPDVANPDQTDWDGDGIGDACDAPDNIHSHVWSPDSRRIAFARCPSNQVWDCELWVSEPDRSHAVMIKNGIAAPGLSDWQDDAILYALRAGQDLPSSYNGEGETFRIDADGSNDTQVTFTYTNGIRTSFFNPSYTNIGTVRWVRFVPGLPAVYFLAHNGNGWHQTYRCNDDGTDGWASVSGPYAWWSGLSPTGDHLLYTTAADFNVPMAVVAHDTGGAGAVTIATSVLPRVEIAVSPDGRQVAYVGTGNADRDIHVVGIDGTSDTALVADQHDDVLFSFVDDGGIAVWPGGPGQPWTPDGAWIFFASTRAGLTHLFRARPDGTDLEQVTSGTSCEFLPTVSPDGRFLSYHRVAAGDTSLGQIDLVIEPLELP